MPFPPSLLVFADWKRCESLTYLFLSAPPFAKLAALQRAIHLPSCMITVLFVFKDLILIVPAPLQKVGTSFLVFDGKSRGKFVRILREFCKNSGQIKPEHFSLESLELKNIFWANFTPQTCHPKPVVLLFPGQILKDHDRDTLGFCASFSARSFKFCHLLQTWWWCPRAILPKKAREARKTLTRKITMSATWNRDKIKRFEIAERQRNRNQIASDWLCSRNRNWNRNDSKRCDFKLLPCFPCFSGFPCCFLAFGGFCCLFQGFGGFCAEKKLFFRGFLALFGFKQGNGGSG